MARKPKSAVDAASPPPLTERAPLIAVGLACGVAAAIAVGTRVGIDQWKVPVVADKSGIEAQLALLSIGLNPAYLVTAVLVAVAIVVAEWFRIRFTLYYMVAGGLAVVAAAYAMGLQQAGAQDPMVLWKVYATAGVLGGAIYWLIAGRRV
ncbi:MAG: hypothetical protein SH859_05135 [Hyphomicrobium aestuarii]|nr:hypothetical protein [Hyphomicrobium aestuarii]